jgi:UPF0755 protein
MKKSLLIILVIAPLVSLILVGARVYYSLEVWRYEGPSREVVILPGQNFSQINAQLAKQQLISTPRLFHRYGQFKGYLNKLRTGRFLIKQNSNMLDVYNTLLNEKSIAFLFTIPEGKNIYEIAKMLEEKELAKATDFLAAVKDKKLLAEMGINAETAEGYLYPESYDFAPQLPAKEIAKTMIKQFHKKITPLDFTGTSLSPREVLILASIVEKETGDKKERAMVAGVFHNRLKIHMRLQSDPTTVYGMFERYTGNITKLDLQTPSDYNTYTLKALPKGPICNPGIEAIKAVLSPADHKFLYFVSQNDGTHIFSENYGAHTEAVKKWQLNSKNREGRSWRQHHDN